MEVILTAEMAFERVVPEAVVEATWLDIAATRLRAAARLKEPRTNLVCVGFGRGSGWGWVDK